MDFEAVERGLIQGAVDETLMRPLIKKRSAGKATRLYFAGTRFITRSHSAKRRGQSVGQGTAAGRRPKP